MQKFAIHFYFDFGFLSFIFPEQLLGFFQTENGGPVFGYIIGQNADGLEVFPVADQNADSGRTGISATRAITIDC